MDATTTVRLTKDELATLRFCVLIASAKNAKAVPPLEANQLYEKLMRATLAIEDGPLND